MKLESILLTVALILGSALATAVRSAAIASRSGRAPDPASTRVLLTVKVAAMIADMCIWKRTVEVVRKCIQRLGNCLESEYGGSRL